MRQTLITTVSPTGRNLLILLLIVFFSGCGGSGGSSGTPTVTLTVSLFDQLSGGSPSGDKVNIAEVGGGLNFTCYQSQQNQDVGVDTRCAFGTASNISGSGATIIFNSIPTERQYTLTHFDAAEASDGNCTIDIQSTSVLIAQSPCTKDVGVAVSMALNTGVTPN